MNKTENKRRLYSVKWHPLSSGRSVQVGDRIQFPNAIESVFSVLLRLYMFVSCRDLSGRLKKNPFKFPVREECINPVNLLMAFCTFMEQRPNSSDRFWYHNVRNHGNQQFERWIIMHFLKNSVTYFATRFEWISWYLEDAFIVNKLLCY